MSSNGTSDTEENPPVPGTSSNVENSQVAEMLNYGEVICHSVRNLNKKVNVINAKISQLYTLQKRRVSQGRKSQCRRKNRKEKKELSKKPRFQKKRRRAPIESPGSSSPRARSSSPIERGDVDTFSSSSEVDYFEYCNKYHDDDDRGSDSSTTTYFRCYSPSGTLYPLSYSPTVPRSQRGYSGSSEIPDTSESDSDIPTSQSIVSSDEQQEPVVPKKKRNARQPPQRLRRSARNAARMSSQAAEDPGEGSSNMNVAVSSRPSSTSQEQSAPAKRVVRRKRRLTRARRSPARVQLLPSGNNGRESNNNVVDEEDKIVIQIGLSALCNPNDPAVIAHMELLRQSFPDDPSTWSVDEVAQFLERLDPQALGPLAELFREQDVDGRALLLFNSEMLKDLLGVNASIALRFCNLINRLKEDEDSGN